MPDFWGMDILQTIGERAILAACKLPLTQERIDNVPHIIRAIEEHGITMPTQIAYILATVAHECSFRCIEEIRAKEGTAVRKMQDRYWPSGYYGRGFCQLTWGFNYEKFGKLLNIPLKENPELALEPYYSAEILVLGMRDGLFSGKKLSDYIYEGHTDYIRARRTVNGNFQAERVALHAARLFTLLN